MGHFIEVTRYCVVADLVLQAKDEDYRVNPRGELKQKNIYIYMIC